jgi:hypothetical protein
LSYQSPDPDTVLLAGACDYSGANRSLCRGAAFSVLLRRCRQRGGQGFEEGEEVLESLAVAGEGLGAVAAVDGGVELLVGVGQGRGIVSGS